MPEKMYVEDGKQKSVLHFALVCKELQEKIKEHQKDLKNFKRELRMMMKDYEIHEATNEHVSVKINYPKSFDLGSCRMEHAPEITKFTKFETRTITDEIFDKKGFKKYYPDLFKEFNLPLTPRLTIK
jgi:hypothetical protein